MTFKLVVLDLDGTLLRPDNSISSKTQKTIAECIKRGICVTIATGRLFPSVLPFAKALNLKDPLITANGADIRNPRTNEQLFFRPIDSRTARELMAFFKDRGWYIQSYVGDNLYVYERNETALEYGRLTFLDPIELKEKLFTLNESPTKLLSIAKSPEEAVLIREAVQEEFGERIYAAVSNRLFVDMAHPEVSKARGVKILTEKMGIKSNEMMAIGDSENDLPLFEMAGFSVAMGNARKEIQDRADAVTSPNYDDGVAAALERYVLQDP